VHAIDIIAVCAAVLVIVLCAAVLARQRYMLRVAGGQPIAVQVRGERWIYGIGRYVGSELRWYRALGVGTRPTAVLDRSELSIVASRAPRESELSSLPATAIVVECRRGDGAAMLAFSESGYTGFVSWLESASRS
jgi:hypothetical protein